MYTITQIQSAATRYIDTDLAPSLDGWAKLIVPGLAALAISNAPALAAKYRAHPIAVAIGAFDDSGNVDIDRIYQVACDRIGTDKYPVDIPKVGRIRLGREALDKLYKYIKEA